MKDFIKLVSYAIKLSVTYTDGRDIVDKIFLKYKPLFKMISQGQYYGISSATGDTVRITYANREDTKVEIEIKINTKWGQ